MIGIIGHMSGGKTYFAVEKILGWMLSGHVVATNIILNCRAVTSYLGVSCVVWKRLYYYITDRPSGYHQIHQSDYYAYPCGSERGSPDYDRRLCYIVLDEVSSIFDSMVHASDSSIQAVATWARHSRKRGQEVVLIMQFSTELHKRLRNHVVEYWMCSNSNDMKIPYLGLRLPFFARNMSLRTLYAPDLETKLSPTSWVSFDPRVYRCYNTSQVVVGHDLASPPALVSVDRSGFRYQHQKAVVAFLTFIYLVSCILGLVVIYASRKN